MGNSEESKQVLGRPPFFHETTVQRICVCLSLFVMYGAFKMWNKSNIDNMALQENWVSMDKESQLNRRNKRTPIFYVFFCTWFQQFFLVFGEMFQEQTSITQKTELLKASTKELKNHRTTLFQRQTNLCLGDPIKEIQALKYTTCTLLVSLLSIKNFNKRCQLV